MKNERKHRVKKYLAFVLACVLLVVGIPKINLIVQAEIDGREKELMQKEDSAEQMVSADQAQSEEPANSSVPENINPAQERANPDPLKSNPVIEVSYDPVSVSAAEYNEFYKTARKATVTVKNWDANGGAFDGTVLYDIQASSAAINTSDLTSGLTWAAETLADSSIVYKTEITFPAGSAYRFHMNLNENDKNNAAEYGTDIFMADDAAPAFGSGGVQSQPVNGNGAKSYSDASGKTWYNQDAAFSFTVQDAGSGLKSVSFEKASNTYQDFKEYTNKSYSLSEYLEGGVEYGKRGETAEQSFDAGQSVQTNGDGIYQLTVKASDYAGNETTAQSGVVGIDKTAPELTAVSNVNTWVKDKAVITFTPSDSGSGIAHVYYAKGNAKSDSNKVEVTEQSGSYAKEFTQDGGDYVCWAVDNVGNESDAVPFVVKIDREAPEVVGITFAGKGNSDGSGFEESVNVTAANYGYYFQENTTVKVRVTDKLSGVESVSYQLQEVGQAKGAAVKITELKTDTDGVLFASFVIPANFKGQLFVTAADNAGNTSGEVTPDGIIVEDETKHKQNASVTITLPALTDGRKAYADGISGIAVTAQDSYTGLRKVEAVFSCNGVEEKQTVEVANDGTLSGNAEGWTKTASGSDNLVIKLEKALAYNKEGKDITLRVTLTDRAGYETTEEKIFSIDKTQPSITVTYESLDPEEPGVSGFCKSGCKAVIRVADLTIDKNGIAFDIRSSVPEVNVNTEQLEWSRVNGETIPTWQAELPFTEDSYYRLGITAVDDAGHTANYESDAFAVDKTLPVIGGIQLEDEASAKKYEEEKNGKTIYWYNRDMEFSFQVQDMLSGLKSVQASNMAGFDWETPDILIANYGLEDYSVGGGNESINFGKRGMVEVQNCEGIQTNGDGLYQFAVSALDYAGNNASTESDVIGIDTAGPTITDITFKPANTKDKGTWNNPDREEPRAYGYYFQGKAAVTVTASDTVTASGKDDVSGSGVASITYIMTDINGTETKDTVKVNADNKITFETPDNFKGQICVYATDLVDNKGAALRTDGVITETKDKHKDNSGIEVTLPETEYHDAEGHNLYQNEIEIPVTVTGSYSGLRKIEWTISSSYQDTGNNQKGTVEIGNNSNDANVLSEQKDGWKILEKDSNLVTKMEKTFTVRNNSNDITLKVRMTDRAGNVTEYNDGKGIVFSIDKNDPEITVEYDSKDSPSTSMDKEYKAFYGKERKATITVKERNFDEETAAVLVEKAVGSSEDAIISDWKIDKNKLGKEDAAEHTCTVTWPGDSAYRLSIEVTDLAGRTATYRKNGLPDIFMVDKKKPTLSKKNLTVEPTDPVMAETYTDAQGVTWYNQNVRFLFTAKDGCAGLYRVTTNAYAMDGLTGKFKKDIDTVYELQDYTVGEKDYGKRGQVEEQNYSVTSDTKNNASQKYRLAAKATDYAGNETSMSSDIIGIDRQKPRITAITFEGTGNQDSAWKGKTTVSEEDYGYYFRDVATVKITATDVNENGSSGVKSISYQLKDITDTKERSFITPALQTDENGETFITFTVPSGFKGQIYAYATDHVGNEGNVEQPDGAIRENADQRGEARIEVKSPQTALKDEEGRPLYDSDITFHLMAEDIHSGIGKVEWSVTSAEDTGNNQSGTIVVNPDGTLSESSWTVKKTDENLVTRLERNITVRNNSNDIKLKVTLTDRAGNVTEYNNGEGAVFSIDKSAPQIDVTYLENDASNDKYYNKDRTAVITVTERNFDEEATNMQIQITNTDSVIPAYGTWTHGGDLGTDRATHTCRITYAADGDYTFTMGSTDKAKNSAVYGKTDEFTIDQTKPEISVTYSTDGLSNTIYYKKECVATITVTEHNFNDAGMVVTQTAELDGQSIPAPSGISWSGSGDVHTAVISYDTDGDYTLSVSGQDMASNELEAYTGTKFVVDMTEPEIEITDVDDMTAYNGTVAPGVRFDDVNCDADSVKITLKGYEHEAQDLTGSLSRNAHGGSIRLPDFDHTAEVDDVYTLTAVVSDMAGNSKEVSKVFSVNRYGSNYILGDDTQKLVDDYYANKEEDLVIREINVSSLQTEGITYSRDGEMVTLEADKDYDVKEEGTEYASWKEYTYTVHADNFAEEGAYTVTVLSTDAAKNSMSNRTAKTKEYTKEVAFVIDKTAPTIVTTGVENNKQYAENEREIKIDSQDNVAIDSLEMYLNDSGTPVKTWTQEELTENDGIMSYMLKAASNWQNMRFVALDKAGNRKESDTLRCLLTTNIWVQYINNRAALITTCILAVLIVGTSYFVFIKRRKKEQKKPNANAR